MREDTFREGIRKIGGIVLGAGLLASVVSGTTELQDDLFHNKVLAQSVQEQQTMQEEELSRALNFENMLDNENGIELTGVLNSSMNYSVLFSEISVDYTVKRYESLERSNSIEKINKAVEDDIQLLNQVYLSEVDVSSVPGVLRSFVTNNRALNYATDIAIESAQELGIDLSEKEVVRSGKVYRKSLEGVYDLEKARYNIEEGTLSFGKDSVKIGTDIYTWINDEEDKVYSAIINYSKEDLEAEYLDGVSEVSQKVDISSDLEEEIYRFFSKK